MLAALILIACAFVAQASPIGFFRRLAPEDWFPWKGRLKPLENRTFKRRWQYIHIPKTAGSSFLRDSPMLLPIGAHMQGNDEKTWYGMRHAEQRNKSVGVAVFFRHPVEHVLSQFLECKYDPWFKKMDEHKRFPAANLSEPYDGFERWVSHFVTEGSEARDSAVPQNIDRFGCYNPWNMQARYMAVGNKDKGFFAKMKAIFKGVKGHGADVKHLEPDLAIAERNVNLTTFVGIQNLYTESLCLFRYFASGHIPRDDCSCGGRGAVERQSHAIHHSPPHNVSKLHDSVVSDVWKMVRVDAQLFQFALRVFEVELRKVEAATNMTIVCPQHLADVKHEAQLLLDNIASQNR